MRKLRSLVGQPLIVKSRRAGRVIQGELTESLDQLNGVWINAGLSGTRFIQAENLEMLGQVAVLADDIGKRARRKPSAMFRRAVGTDGRKLGAITGAEIDELTFRVEALELSQGLWDDLFNGRVNVRQFTLNRKNGDVIIDVAQIEKEVTNYEERYDEGTDYRRTDRRIGGSDVRSHELADGTQNEPTDEENWTLDLCKGRRSDV